jgi:hypothetical protein
MHLYNSAGSTALAVQAGSAIAYFGNDQTEGLLASSLGTTGYKFRWNLSAPDNSLYLSSGGLFGVNTTSPGAMIQANTAAAATKGLIVKGFTSQSANLTEWQNSSGTAIAAIDASGDLLLKASSVLASGFGYLDPGATAAGVITLYGGSGEMDFNVTGAFFMTFKTTGTERMRILSGGNIGIGETAPGAKLQVNTGTAATKGLIVKGFTSQSANLTEWQNSAGSNLAYMDSSGNFFAVSKSFLIDHPTPEKKAQGKKLHHASLEGPENGVYFRGRLDGETEIALPDYWKDLVDAESITVNLTARKYAQPNLFVEDVNIERISVSSSCPVCCDFVVYGTRKDIAKLEVEPDGE